jgi:transposase-like protein
MFKGVVEVDEMLMGGKVRGGKRGWGAENKCCVVGVVERGGRIKTTHISDRDRANILPCIEEKVEKGTVVNTDEFRAYNVLNDKGYQHQTVTHSKYQWANGDAHTNTMEGHWSNLQKSIFGTHTFVARRHLQKYLAEFDFRYSNRHGQIFDEIVKRIA